MGRKLKWCLRAQESAPVRFPHCDRNRLQQWLASNFVSTLSDLYGALLKPINFFFCSLTKLGIWHQNGSGTNYQRIVRAIALRVNNSAPVNLQVWQCNFYNQFLYVVFYFVRMVKMVFMLPVPDEVFLSFFFLFPPYSPFCHTQGNSILYNTYLDATLRFLVQKIM